MSHAALDRARRFSLLLCELAALVAPPAARGRVVDERRSHLHESAAAGVSGASELLRALRGCLDDLRTCLSTRAASGATPLRVAMFTDAATSIAVSGLLVGVFAPTLPAEKYAPAVYVGRVAITLASIVLFGGYATRGVRRLRSRRSSARGD